MIIYLDFYHIILFILIYFSITFTPVDIVEVVMVVAVVVMIIG